MPKLLRFDDLKQRRIVDNRMTLKRWIDRGEFPRGRLAGPNTRAWTETEIEQWWNERPVDRKSAEAS